MENNHSVQLIMGWKDVRVQEVKLASSNVCTILDCTQAAKFHTGL